MRTVPHHDVPAGPRREGLGSGSLVYTLRRFASRSAAVVVAVGGLLVLGASIGTAADGHCWPLASPDGRSVIAVSLMDDGSLGYEVTRDGKPVIRHSELGLRRDDQDFSRPLAFERAGPIEARRETYDLFAGLNPHVDHLLNHRTLAFRNSRQAALEIDLAASDEGVAFRYRFPDSSPASCTVQAEATGFALPPDARGWQQPYHAASRYTPAYEDFYFKVAVGDPPPRSREKPLGWAFPALFQLPATATWLLLTESTGPDSFCGCHLGPDSADGVYHIAFPAADEVTPGWHNADGPEPRHALPWTLPWRVIVLGKSAGAIATATLVTDLAPPCAIADTSWIHPGRASWSWWSGGANTAARFAAFSDFSARMGWEYTLFDAGWWEPGLGGIARYAQAKGVMPLAWLSAGDFAGAGRGKRKLDEVEAAGIRGVKVDFWCSDRQPALAAMLALFEDAASRRMVVDLHGCTLPRGWQRTWPNFLTAEAVLGAESYMYESQYTAKAAELNTILPFTRNAVGPMDYTPVACSPKKYPRTTTAAHELATALVFTSGLIHYADKPEFFDSLPAAALQVLRDAPARWDETKCLLGEPGRVVVFARRSGQCWFIAGLNGTAETLPLTLDLSAFAGFHQRLEIAEGSDALMQVTAHPLAEAAAWQHAIPPRGGFILRLDP